jgi:NAD(P)-dependent dehydrogenase (short-subunit alcohol dehydrogenase family)
MQQMALVTGSDRGLGLALVTGLLAENWHVFAGQYRADWSGLDTLADQFPGALHIIPLDIGSTESVQAAAQAVSAVTDRIDLVINNAGVISPTSPRTIREPQDYDEMHRLFDINALGALRVVEAFLPLTDKGALKRVCYVSSEAGSIERAYRTSWYDYCMSKAALNMGVSILFNHLHPEGYTFRVYHPGWVRSYLFGTKQLEAELEPEEAAVPALAYFLKTRSDEDRLVMRDWQGNEWPW